MSSVWGIAVKIAVIGCGKQAPKHIRAFQRLTEIHEVALADVLPDRARAAAEQLGTGVYATVDDLFADRAAEAIIICTPTPTHAPLIRRSLETGKHVMCEKPFCETVGDAEAMASELTRLGLVGRIGYIYRFAPMIAEAKAMIAGAEEDGITPALGKITAASFRISGPGSHAVWKHRRAQGGGVVNEMISHMVDLVIWFFGPVQTCEVLIKNRVFDRRTIENAVHAADAEDFIIARLKTASGISVTVEGDFISAQFTQQIEIRGENGTITASIDPNSPSFYHLRQERGRYHSGLHMFPPQGSDLYTLQAKDFIAAISDGASQQIGCTMAQAAESLAVLDQMHAKPMISSAA